MYKYGLSLTDKKTYLSHGTHTLNAVYSPFPFREVVPSWNIYSLRRKKVSYTVDIKLCTKTGKWTNKLSFAAEGEQYTKRILSDGCVAVKTDYIASSEELVACQLIFNVTSDFPVFFDSAYYAFAENEFVSGQPFEDNFKPPAISLDIPFRSQMYETFEIMHHVCSSASVCAVMEYFGKKVKTANFAAHAFDSYYKQFGLWHRAIQTACRYGFKGYVKYFCSFEEVYSYIKNGQPVIACISYGKDELKGSKTESSAGHVLAIRGFDSGGNIICCDSAAYHEEQGITVYDRHEFAKAWFSSAGGIGYIIYPLKSNKII